MTKTFLYKVARQYPNTDIVCTHTIFRPILTTVFSLTGEEEIEAGRWSDRIIYFNSSLLPHIESLGFTLESIFSKDTVDIIKDRVLSDKEFEWLISSNMNPVNDVDQGTTLEHMMTEVCTVLGVSSSDPA